MREQFNAEALVEEAMREDIPWRQWNAWMRDRIVNYLRENNRVITVPHDDESDTKCEEQEPEVQEHEAPEQGDEKCSVM